MTEDRNGRFATNSSAVNRSVVRTTLPSGVITAETPTVEICTAARPVVIACRRDIASCCVDSAVHPNDALFVGITSTCAPWSTASRTISSYATSKQMTVPSRYAPCPSRLGTSTTGGSTPAIMSVVTRSTWSEKTRRTDRSGMYSPNGAGCCFAYRPITPCPACHSSDTLYRPPVSGNSCAPTAADAASSPSATSDAVCGSRSLPFSGHSTTSSSPA